MTQKEAIKILKRQADGYYPKTTEALIIAIKALEREPCEDTISRKAVLDKLNRLIEVEQLQGTDEMGYGRERVSAYECMIQEVESEYLYPNIQLNEDEGWIPCSERLPEDHVDVLICLKDSQITIGVYNSHRLPFNSYPIGWGARFKHSWGTDDVIAWMPLPQAYKAESEVEE